MSYEIIASRKRPKSFEELVGQEFVVATIKNSVLQERIAHAYLFSGPRGVGKTSAARILAKTLNCEKGPTDTPCGHCPACKEISRGQALDVIEIDGASNTSVNDVREIREEVLFAPNAYRFKVYIIDEVHMLSNSAFNALLKTIEEPPPYIVFIFATTEIHKVPATIRSRCQQFNFRLIAIEQIKEKLAEVLDELSIPYDAEALLWIAREATGSLRDAYTILDQVISFAEGKITLKVIKDKLGIVGVDELNEIFLLMSRMDSQGILEKTDEILTKGISVEQFVIDLATYFRTLLLLKNGLTKESFIGASVGQFPVKELEQFSLPQLEQAIELLFRLYKSLRYSLNQKFELELLLHRFSKLKIFLTNQELVARIESLKNELTEGQLQTMAQPAEADSSVEPALSASTITALDTGEEEPDEQEHAGDTAGLVDAVYHVLRKHKLALASAIKKALRYDLAAASVVFYFRTQDAFSGELVLRERDAIGQAVKEVLGRAVKISIDYTMENDSRQDKQEVDDSNINMVKKVFKGEIIDP